MRLIDADSVANELKRENSLKAKLFCQIYIKDIMPG